MAEWDTKLPLNIEDTDITSESTQLPTERRGTTGMSPSLFTYWVIHEQRAFHHNDKVGFAPSWASSATLPQEMKNRLIDRLESGLNQNFLQYCDPIKPLDTFVHIMARAFITGMRRVALHAILYHNTIPELENQIAGELLDVCVRSLEYDVALHSQPSLKNFNWRLNGYFPWSACESFFQLRLHAT